jgi:hypothetical protein
MRDIALDVICDSSRSVGAGRAMTRNSRGLTRSVIRLMMPPLPAAFASLEDDDNLKALVLNPKLELHEFYL